MSNERREFTMRRSTKTAERARDTSVLFRRGAFAEVLLAVDGTHERWRGEILRGASLQRPSAELQPFGCSTSIEFPIDVVVECFEDRQRWGTPVFDAIAKLQAMRVGRKR